MRDEMVLGWDFVLTRHLVIVLLHGTVVSFKALMSCRHISIIIVNKSDEIVLQLQ